MRAFEFLTELNVNIPQDLGQDRTTKLTRIVNKLESDPALIDEIFKHLSLTVKDDKKGDFKSRILTMIGGDSADQDLSFAPNFLRSLAAAIEQTEGTVEEKLQFANTLGKVEHIDTKKLTSVGVSSWADWLTGTEFSKRLFDNLFNAPAFKTNNKGPGEAALAILSPNITLLTGAGDISINGTKIEVKGGESVSGGRLSPTSSTVGNVQGDKAFWSKLFPDDNQKADELSNVQKVNGNNFGSFVAQYQLNADQIASILSATFRHESVSGDITNISKKLANITALDLATIALKNYAASQGDDNFLILQRDVKQSIYFTVKDIESIYTRLSVTIPIIDTDARSAGKAQLGILKKERK